MQTALIPQQVWTHVRVLDAAAGGGSESYHQAAQRALKLLMQTKRPSTELCPHTENDTWLAVLSCRALKSYVAVSARAEEDAVNWYW